MENIISKYNFECNRTIGSDINEHMPTLKKYASKCNSVFETGVRGCVSSWGLVYGLLSNENGIKKKLFMNDIHECKIDDLIDSTQGLNIEIKSKWCNNLELEFNDETYDLTFIDTWHVYGQLKRELNKFSKITNKYIIMHDTTVDEFFGESVRLNWNIIQQSKDSGIPIEEISKGLSYAINEFLDANNDWIMLEKYTNNNGVEYISTKDIGYNLKINYNNVRKLKSLKVLKLLS
jgi:hypothetical protein